MREECRKLGLDNKGVKKVLRARLLEHMLNDNGTEGDNMAVEQNVEESKETTNAIEKENENSPEESGEAKEQQDSESRMSCDSVKADHHAPTAAATNANEVAPEASADSMKEEPVAATKEKQSIVKSMSPMKAQLQLAAKGSVQAEYYKDSIPEDDISPPGSEVTTSSVASKISGTKVREIVSKLSAHKSQYSSATPSASASSGSSLLKSVQAKKEARMARMAEIREKVRCHTVCIWDRKTIISHTFFLCIAPVATCKDFRILQTAHKHRTCTSFNELHFGFLFVGFDIEVLHGQEKSRSPDAREGTSERKRTRQFQRGTTIVSDKASIPSESVQNPRHSRKHNEIWSWEHTQARSFQTSKGGFANGYI